MASSRIDNAAVSGQLSAAHQHDAVRKILQTCKLVDAVLQFCSEVGKFDEKWINLKT